MQDTHQLCMVITRTTLIMNGMDGIACHFILCTHIFVKKL